MIFRKSGYTDIFIIGNFQFNIIMFEFGYSPFTDNNGNKKNIFNLNFTDLEQLQTKEIEEGEHIEYKVEFNSSVKKKIPKIISSFANESGGWIFVGIENKTRKFCYIENNGIEEIIQQLLKEHTSPIPKIEIKFLKSDSSRETGILVIWVPEGIEPPYIANGNIFVRVGSTSTPLKNDEDLFVAIKDRFYLDRLYQKSKARKQEIADFCNKKISISNDIPTNLGIPDKGGICNIYIIPVYNLNLFEHLETEEDIISLFLAESKIPKPYFSGNDLFCEMNIEFKKATQSYMSIIFRSSDVLDYFQNTVAWEQFFNGSAKFHIPISYYPNQKSIIGTIKQNDLKYENSEIFSKFQYYDGETFIKTIILCLGSYFKILKKVIPDFSEVFIIIELENIKRLVLFFDLEEYRQVIKEKGLIFSDKQSIKIDLYNLNAVKIEENNLMFYLLLINQVFRSFGYTNNEFAKFFTGTMRKHEKKS
jgi:hypothetical protein